jgi:hypothetical protein
MRHFSGPKRYSSYQDFEREEIRPYFRIGFSVDDLENEATFRERDFSIDEDGIEELDFN